MSGRARNPSGGVPPAGSTGTQHREQQDQHAAPVTKVGSATASVLTPATSASSHGLSTMTATQAERSAIDDGEQQRRSRSAPAC